MVAGCEFQAPQKCLRLINVKAISFIPYCRCCLNSKRNSNRLNLSSHAKVRSTHSRNEWMAALNSRFRPRLGAFRLRGFSLTLGTSPALNIALRLRLESKPPSRLRYAPPISKSVSLATRFKAFSPSGRSTVSASFTGATGNGANTKPLFSTIARTFSPFWCLWPVADAVAAFLGDGVGAIAVQDAEIEAILLRQISHAGDEGLIERAIIGPSGEHLVDGCVVDHGGAIVCLGYRQALPLHARIEHPEDQIEDAVIAEFAFRPAPGHREVWEDKCGELRLGELNRNWRCGGALCHLAGPNVAS